MSVTAPPTLTAPPTAPTTDRATFSARAFAMVAWFATMVSEMTSALSNVYNNASEAYSSGMSAAASQAAATAVAGAALFNSGATYAAGQAAVSAVNYLTYRRTTAGSGATDPANDTGGTWVNVGLPPVTIVDVSADTTMVAGMIYRASASCTLTLPASPARGDAVTVCKTAVGITLTIGRNSHKIRTLAENGSVTTKDRYYTLCYVDATVGWDVL